MLKVFISVETQMLVLISQEPSKQGTLLNTASNLRFNEGQQRVRFLSYKIITFQMIVHQKNVPNRL